MAEENGAVEQSLDQQLEALFGEQKSSAPAEGAGQGTPPKSATEQPAVASPPAAKKDGEQPPAKEGVTEETDPVLKALEAIEEQKEPEKKEDPAKPALTDEQTKVLEAIPNVETAAKLYQVVENYGNFANAFESGKYAEVQGMFEAWNADAFEGFLEHIYAQKVASGDWVDRFIAEQEGRGKPHNEVVELKKKVAQLERASQQPKTPAAPAGPSQEQQNYQAYNTHVHALLEQINFNKADRRWIVSDLNARVAADPAVLESLKRGNIKAVNGLFKAVVKEYVNRDKEVVEQKDQKIVQQNQKKIPLGGSASQVEGALPDDIQQVPKGKEDEWMDQQLGKLKRLVGK